MSGIIRCIYGRRDLDEVVLDLIDCVLASISAPLIRTRKGRVWSCRIDGRPIAIKIEVTARVLEDCQDEMLALGLLPDQAPFLVMVEAACSSDEDARIVESLAISISRVVNGVVGDRQR